MQFSVVTYGTEGDTRPLVGLCRGLLDRGHDVRLFADRSTLSTAQVQGIPTFILAGDMKATVGPGRVGKTDARWQRCNAHVKSCCPDCQRQHYILDAGRSGTVPFR